MYRLKHTRIHTCRKDKKSRKAEIHSDNHIAFVSEHVTSHTEQCKCSVKLCSMELDPIAKEMPWKDFILQ
jgi:hypothetical protein